MAHERFIISGVVRGDPNRVMSVYVSDPKGLPPGYRSQKVNQFFRAFSPR